MATLDPVNNEALPLKNFYYFYRCLDRLFRHLLQLKDYIQVNHYRLG
jgi:hypothetical protein